MTDTDGPTLTRMIRCWRVAENGLQCHRPATHHLHFLAWPAGTKVRSVESAMKGRIPTPLCKIHVKSATIQGAFGFLVNNMAYWDMLVREMINKGMGAPDYDSVILVPMVGLSPMFQQPKPPEVKT